MPFVRYDASGSIIEVVSESSEGAEWISADSQSLLAFLKEANDPRQVAQALQDTDAEFARVTEDLIQVLIRKNVLLFTDLPEPVRQKILARENLRQVLQENEGGLISDEGII